MSWTTSFTEATQVERLFVFFFVVGSGVAVGEVVQAFCRRALEQRVSERQAKAIARALNYVVLLAALYVGVYHVLHLNLKSLAVSLGVAGVALAFASQQVVQNAIAGLLIAVRRPIWYEDWVEIASSGVCQVKDLALMQTVLRAGDGRILYLPNSTVLSSLIVNYSRSGLVEVAVPVTAPADTDPDRVARLVQAAAESHPNAHGEETTLERLLRGGGRRGAGADADRFRPRLLVTELKREETVPSVRIWIVDVNRKQAIVSEFLQDRRRRLEEKAVA